MNKSLFATLTLGTLLFVGCAEKGLTKTEPTKEAVVSQVEKEPTASEDLYGFVIAKSIRECKEHNITLDKQRTSDFMRKSPRATIEKAAQSEVKASRDLCNFFAEETSVEKAEKVDEFVAKLMTSCSKVGIALPEEAIHNKVRSLPFFVIKKGLAMENESTLEECQLMEKI